MSAISMLSMILTNYNLAKAFVVNEEKKKRNSINVLIPSKWMDQYCCH